MNTKSTIEINEANFEAEVLKSSQPLLVELLKVARVELDRSLVRHS